MIIPLRASVTATANASGRASVITGPEKYGDTWAIELITSASNSTVDCQLKVYRGIESETSVIESSYSGRSDTSPCNHRFGAGEKLIFVWTNCSVGAICSSRIEGNLESGRM